MDDWPCDTDRAVYSQPTKTFSIKTDNIFDLDSIYENFDDVIDHTVNITIEYELYFTKFGNFQFVSKTRDVNCSHEFVLKTKLNLTHT